MEIKHIAVGLAVLFAGGVVLGFGAWAIANVWPALIIVGLGGGGAYLYNRNKRVKNTV